MNYSTFEIWTIIILLGVGTFFLRFSFLGVIGDRPLPPFFLRMLRYTAVAVLPAIAAPVVLMPGGNFGDMDPAKVAAAVVTLLVGMFTRNIIAAVLGGVASLLLFSWLL